MGIDTNIQWCDFTGGPFLGCTEVSEGCANCYSREFTQNRLAPILRRAYKAAGLKDWETRPVWGKTAPRVLSKGFWKDIVALNAKAARLGVRYKVFPSLIDWLDEMPAGIIDQDGNWLDAIEILARFLDVIRRCPNLDFLLLTKRPELWEKRIKLCSAIAEFPFATCRDWLTGQPPANIWLGVSVENQETVDLRIPQLLAIPAAVRFVSYEPALGPVDFKLDERGIHGHVTYPSINQIIIGGESGLKARPFNVEWARSTIAQCQAAGVACFVKQLGGTLYRSTGWHMRRIYHR